MNNISFDNVYLLLIAVPLILLFAVPFAIAVRKDNRNGHNIASLMMHILMAVFIAFAAAGTTFTTVVTKTEVYVVADVSYSTKSKLDTIDSYIKNMKLPDNSKLGLVCFGKDYQLVSKLDDPKKVKSVKNATVDDTQTNATAALNYAGTLFSDGVIKRIVLITDGMQTNRSDENSIYSAVKALNAEPLHIQVDAIFIDSNPNPETHTEVQISGVKSTDKAYLGSKQVANVTVQSSYDVDAKVTLKRNGEVIEENKYAKLTNGVNIVEVELDTSEAGTFDYEVAITADGDASDKNNVYYFTQTVTDEIKTLFITQNWNDCMAAVERYGTKGILEVYEFDKSVTSSNKTSFLNKYKNSENITIKSDNPTIPFSIDDLCKYDEIVLANADISQFNNYYPFIINLKDAVYNFGKSLVTMGNLYIQNRDFGDDLDEWDLYQTYEGMLPVKYGNSDDDPKLYTFVIDKSRSTGHLYRLDKAKEVVIRLLKMLNDTDYVSIFTFDGEVEALYNAKSLKDKDEVIDTVEHLEIRNGTMVGSGLQRAYEQIKNLSYSEKQVLLVTDGVTFGDDPYKPEDVVAQMVGNEIATSVFDLGRQGDNAKPEANGYPEYKEVYNNLVKLAKIGKGNYYYCADNLYSVDDVVFGAVADDLTEAVIEEETSVNVKIPRDKMFENIDLRTMDFPNVSGYVYSGLKPSATTVLTVNHKRSTGVKVEKPLYAHWEHGEGKVSSFTSSIGNWTNKWEGELKDIFFNNLFDINVPEEKNENPYALDIVRDGTFTTVNIKLPSVLPLRSSATILVTAPDGSQTSESMIGTGSSYYYNFNAADLGKYTIDVTYSYDGKDFTTKKHIYNCYISEYDAFIMFDPSELESAMDGVDGTLSTDGKLELVNSDDMTDKYLIRFTVPLLIATAALFVIDIAVRKLTLDDLRSFFGFGKGKKKEGKKR